MKDHLLLKELEFVPSGGSRSRKECEIPGYRERIKHKCKLCGDITGKDYARLFAYITSNYTSNELLYNEGIEMDIVSINFERSGFSK